LVRLSSTYDQGDQAGVYSDIDTISEIFLLPTTDRIE
jgi:hypothetical protein